MASLGGGLSGASSGAGLGSMFAPGIGTALGALGGGLLGLFGGGTKSKFKPFNKQSLNSLEELLQGGGLSQSPLYEGGSSFLQNLLSGNPEAFSAFEAPYLRNFQQNIAPGIAERFAGAGTGAGALGSSAFANSLAQASKDLQLDLAGLRSNLQMQALPQALQYAQQPIQNRFGAAQAIPNQFYEIPGQAGLAHGLLGGVGQGFGQGFGNLTASKFANLFNPQQSLGTPGV